MKRIIVKVIVLSLVIGLASISSVYAQQANFQVSPPPIASPEFEAGQKEQKISGTYVGMSGEGIDFTGLGVNYISRNAGSDTTAIDFSVGFFTLGGSMGFGGFDGDMYMIMFPMSVNGEYQAMKTPTSSLILFGGPTLSFSFSSLYYEYEYTYYNPWSGTTTTYTDSDTLLTTTIMYGVQGGAQLGATMGSFKFSPFAMMQSLQGSSTTSNGTSTSADIPAFTTISYGLDILYVPWDITLSSILQKASESEDNEAIDTTIIQLSWKF